VLEATAGREGAATIIESSRQNAARRYRSGTEAVSVPPPGDKVVEAMR
jgi:hypothetical protein